MDKKTDIDIFEEYLEEMIKVTKSDSQYNEGYLDSLRNTKEAFYRFVKGEK